MLRKDDGTTRAFERLDDELEQLVREATQARLHIAQVRATLTGQRVRVPLPTRR